MAPASYQAATSDSKAWTRSGVLCATMAPVTFCCSSLPVYGVKSRLIVTFGATCLYWFTNSWSVPPWVPGSVPFMPCQKVIVTGAALVVAAAVGLADAAGTVEVAAAAAGGVVGALVGAAGADVDGPGAAVEQAAAMTEISTGINLSKRIRVLRSAPSTFQATAGNAFQKMPLHQDEQHHHWRDRERAGRHQRVIVRAVFQSER